MALNLQHQTAAQFAARFWAKVRTAKASGDQVTFHRLIWWLYQRIQAGDLTSNQVRLSYNAAFNKALTSTQWNTLVTDRILPIVQRYDALQSEGDL